MKVPVRPTRNFLPQDLSIETWSDLEPWFNRLLNVELDSLLALNAWLKNLSELEAVIEEDLAWRYIRMTINTKDEALAQRYQQFVTDIQPNISPFGDKFNKKLVNSPLCAELKGEAYDIYVRKIQEDIRIFREKNIAIQADLQTKAQEFGAITGAMNVDVGGKTLTMQAAAAELQKGKREYREAVWHAMNDVRLKSRDELDQLFTELVAKRHEMAQNAGFENFRDYQFSALGRFDYSKEDCFDFHESIALELTPLVGTFQEERREKLGVVRLRPWDLAIDPEGNEPLNPFGTVEDLIANSIKAFSKVDPYCGECLEVMNTMKHLDLASKDGKSPGGYNYPLYEIGVPFIFMNAVGTQRDLVTMMHEGGHAVHSFLTRNLELTSFQSCPSEVAELASMSMELISMDHWGLFYGDDKDLLRAKKEHLQDLLAVLPWIAIIDKFQHWVYENPHHSIEERTANWLAIYNQFMPDNVDYSGIESSREAMWQKQLHLFEVPFYYIEYGMAQLGAVAVWRNYKQDPKKAVEQYKSALALGYTKSIGQIYKTAGIEFNFSRDYVRELVDFVKHELALLG
jgi:oligoendopeptidase F